MLQQYKVLVRLYSDYHVQFWLPMEVCYYTGKGAEEFTRILQGEEGLNYKERLNRLGHFSLEHTRVSG